MRASDLSINDWAHRHYKNGFEGEVSFDFKVTQLPHRYGDENQVWGESPDGKRHGNMGDVSQIEPVPLTADILKMNGWYCHNDYGMWEDRDDYFRLVCYGDGFSVEVAAREFGSGQLCYIRYVHELQHLLRLVGASEAADNFLI